MFHKLFKIGGLTDSQVMRFGSVLITASIHKEEGVIEWIARAVEDARHLGRVRDRDILTLETLERRFNDSEYYTYHRGSAIAA